MPVGITVVDTRYGRVLFKTTRNRMKSLVRSGRFAIVEQCGNVFYVENYGCALRGHDRKIGRTATYCEHGVVMPKEVTKHEHPLFVQSVINIDNAKSEWVGDWHFREAGGKGFVMTGMLSQCLDKLESS